MSKITEVQKQDFIRGYLQSALDNDHEIVDADTPNERIVDFCGMTFAPSAMEKLTDYCFKFMAENTDDLILYATEIGVQEIGEDDESVWFESGYNCWLSQDNNGGYMDSGSDTEGLSLRLHNAAENMGAVSLCLGNSNMVYFAG